MIKIYGSLNKPAATEMIIVYLPPEISESNETRYQHFRHGCRETASWFIWDRAGVDGGEGVVQWVGVKSLCDSYQV